MDDSSETAVSHQRSKHVKHANPLFNSVQTQCKVRAITEQIPNVHQLLNVIPQSMKLLDYIGIKQSIILEEIFKSCKLTKTRMSLPISSTTLSKLTTSSNDAVLNRVAYMQEKGLIISRHRKVGKGGWVIYEIPKLVYDRLESDALTKD